MSEPRDLLSREVLPIPELYDTTKDWSQAHDFAAECRTSSSS
jgi:hypothetical protein